MRHVTFRSNVKNPSSRNWFNVIPVRVSLIKVSHWAKQARKTMLSSPNFSMLNVHYFPLLWFLNSVWNVLQRSKRRYSPWVKQQNHTIKVTVMGGWIVSVESPNQSGKWRARGKTLALPWRKIVPNMRTGGSGCVIKATLCSLSSSKF